MEAAAIAEIAEISRVNMLAIKSISDFVDVDDIVEQLSKNRELAISNLTVKLEQLITRIL
jgi:nucleoside phosphorylase